MQGTKCYRILIRPVMLALSVEYGAVSSVLIHRCRGPLIGQYGMAVALER